MGTNMSKRVITIEQTICELTLPPPEVVYIERRTGSGHRHRHPHGSDFDSHLIRTFSGIFYGFRFHGEFAVVSQKWGGLPRPLCGRGRDAPSRPPIETRRMAARFGTTSVFRSRS
jgi:hypothetical protein